MNQRTLFPWTIGLLCAVLLSACQVSVGRVSLVTTPTGAASVPQNATSQPSGVVPGPSLVTQPITPPAVGGSTGAGALPTRELSLTVYGLSDIAEGQSKLVGLDAASLISAGGLGLISAGGLGLISAGGLGFTSGTSAGNFRLQNTMTTFKSFVPVQDAVVTLRYFGANGGLVSKTAVKSDENGQLTIQLQGVNEAVEAEAVFQLKVKDTVRTYRLTSPIPGTGDYKSVICPIYTLCNARIRSILQENGLGAPELNAEQLQAAWDALNESGVILTSEMLEQKLSLAEVEKFYMDVLGTVKDPVKKKVITDFIAKIKPVK